MKIFLILTVSFYSLSAYTQEFNRYLSYALLDQSSNSTISDSADYKNHNADGLSISYGQKIREGKFLEFEFSYLGNVGFDYGGYIIYNRYVSVLGFTFLQDSEFLSFGAGGGVMYSHGGITKTDQSGVTITEHLKSGPSALPYFKIQAEIHFSMTEQLQVFGNFVTYSWFQEDGKIEVDDNGAEETQTLSLIQSIRTVNAGIRYYFE